MKIHSLPRDAHLEQGYCRLHLTLDSAQACGHRLVFGKEKYHNYVPDMIFSVNDLHYYWAIEED